MKSPVVKRSIVIAGHKTSVSLEEAFWRGLKDIAATRRVSLSDLVGSIDTERQHGNLSSASSCSITTKHGWHHHPIERLSQPATNLMLPTDSEEAAGALVTGGLSP